jgi:hypothetical protein
MASNMVKLVKKRSGLDLLDSHRKVRRLTLRCFSFKRYSLPARALGLRRGHY